MSKIRRIERSIKRSSKGDLASILVFTSFIALTLWTSKTLSKNFFLGFSTGILFILLAAETRVYFNGEENEGEGRKQQQKS